MNKSLGGTDWEVTKVSYGDNFLLYMSALVRWLSAGIYTFAIRLRGPS